MALKYYFEFTDTEGVKNKCEIYNDDFVGDETLIYGSCSLTKASTKDTLEPIRGGGLKIELEASTDLDFTDLYSEEERTFYVKYYRNDELHSLYWLDPEGLYQSFVEDKWIISLDCTDGLGFLNNLQYVDNVTKEKFIGKQSQLEVIVNCLKRTGFTQNIYVRVRNIVYSGITPIIDVLANTYVNTFRYVKEDNITTMQCNEVLKTILEPYGLVITQRNSSWFICKPNDLYDNTEIDFFGYDSDGIALSPTKLTVDFSSDLGSQINGYYPHHVNENQQISIDNSIGAYRINYKYGLTNSLFDNLYLENVSGVVDEWTVDDATNLTFPNDNRGFILSGQLISQLDLILTSDSITVLEGNQFINKGVIEFSYTETLYGRALFSSKVILTDGTDTRYLDNDGTWKTSSSTTVDFVTGLNKEYIYEIKTDLVPFDGDVYIELYTPSPISFGADYDVSYKVYQSRLLVTDDLGDLKGEIHTFQINDKPSSKIENVKEVLNGDLPSDLYSGTLYENDETTPTTEWNRGNVRDIPLLRIMGEERMKMYAKPLKVFKGDIYGYIDYLSVVSINNISGLFMPIEWSYDCKQNITKVKLKEILNEDIGGINFNGIDYTIDLDYGNVEKPTIKN